MRVLIVDDEPNIVNVLKEYATYSGFQSDTASNGEEAVEKVKKNDYDCIVLDVMMPKMDGFEVAQVIERTKQIPIIIVSAKGEEYDILEGFEIGVDDYIVKPFSPREVMARIKAVVKRNKTDELVFDNLKIDFLTYQVYVNNKLISLAKKEFDLLSTLVKNRGIVLSRDSLLDKVWGLDFDGDSRTVDAHIKMLRHHLGESGEKIKTKRGVGYYFEDKKT